MNASSEKKKVDAARKNVVQTAPIEEKKRQQLCQVAGLEHNLGNGK
jgi:hypothetical protein